MHFCFPSQLQLNCGQYNQWVETLLYSKALLH